LKYWCASSVG